MTDATAPAGVETAEASAAVAPPYTPAAALVSVTLPANAVVFGVRVVLSRLDSNAAPTMTVNVGDALNVSRYVAASTAPRDGGTIDVRQPVADYYRYLAETPVSVRVGTGAATPLAGDVAFSVYWYPARAYVQVRDGVLRELGILGDGRAPSGEEDAQVREALDEVHQAYRLTLWRGQSLANRGALYWPLDLVPVWAARAYQTQAAMRLVDVFGVSDAAANRIAARATLFERELRTVVAVPTTGAAVKAEYF